MLCIFSVSAHYNPAIKLVPLNASSIFNTEQIGRCLTQLASSKLVTVDKTYTVM